jgi:hypothetical protein
MKQITYTSPMFVVEAASVAVPSLWSYRGDAGRLGNDTALTGRRAR